MAKKTGKKPGEWLEETILGLIILIGVLDFLEILPADLDYVKKVVSWTLLGYLFYKVSPTYIFFNNKIRLMDGILIIAYFLLTFKNLVAIAISSIEDSSFFHDLFGFLMNNSVNIETFSFYTGGLMLFLLAIYCAVKVEVKKPSLMHMLHGEGRISKNPVVAAFRAVSILLVFIFFFIAVFNLVMEWLGMATDAPLVMIAVVFYLFYVIRRYRHYRVEHFIYKVGSFGDTFYERFMTMFHYKKTIWLGISGLLVMHLLTEVSNFLIPYVINLRDSLYFSQLGEGHSSLLSLFMQQSIGLAPYESVSLFLIYLLNVFCLLMLLVMPAFFWYILFCGKKAHVNKYLIGVFYSSAFAFIISPVFALSPLNSGSLRGVDIQTNAAANLFPSFLYALLLCVLVFSASMLLAALNSRLLVMIILASSIYFFGYYIILFFISLWGYYTALISLLFGSSSYLLLGYFSLFLAVTALFYAAGFIMFVFGLFRNNVAKKIV